MRTLIDVTKLRKPIAKILGLPINIKHYGAVGDGTTDDTAAIQAAIDYCASLTYGGTVIAPAPSNYYSVARLQAKSKVTFLVPNRSTTFISEQGETWDTQKCWSFGNFYGNDYDTPTAYALNALTYGNTTITLTTAGDSANFEAGDIIFIESTTGAAFANGGSNYENMPAFCQLNVVISVGSGTLTLRHPIHETRSNAQVRRFSRTGLTTAGGTTSLEAVRDFKLLGGTWVASAGKQFFADGGIIDSEISPDVIEAAGGLYGNALAHVVSRIGELRTTSVPIALALGAHNTTVDIGTVQVINSSSLTKIVELSESTRDCTVRIGNVSVSGAVDDGIEFVACRRNACEIGSLRASSISGNAIYFWSPEYAENYPGGAPTSANVEYLKAEYNTGIIRACYAGSVAIGVNSAETSNTSAKYNHGEVNFSGVNPTALVSGNVGASKVLITSPTFYTLKNLEFDYVGYGVSSAAPLSKTVTFPAATLIYGSGSPTNSFDRIVLKFKGVHTGSASTRSLSVTFAGTTIYNPTLPNLSGQGIDVEIVFSILSNTIIAATVSSRLEGTLNIDDVGVTGINLTTTAYNLVIASSVTSSDTINFREFSLKCFRNYSK